MLQLWLQKRFSLASFPWRAAPCPLVITKLQELKKETTSKLHRQARRERSTRWWTLFESLPSGMFKSVAFLFTFNNSCFLTECNPLYLSLPKTKQTWKTSSFSSWLQLVVSPLCSLLARTFGSLAWSSSWRLGLIKEVKSTSPSLEV